MFIARREARDYFAHFTTINYYINVMLKDNKLLRITSDGHKCYSINVTQQRGWSLINMTETEVGELNIFSIKKVFYSSNSIISKDYQLVHSIEVEPSCSLFITKSNGEILFDDLISEVLKTFDKQSKKYIEVYSVDDTIKANAYIDAPMDLIDIYKTIQSSKQECKVMIIKKYIKKDFIKDIKGLKYRCIIEDVSDGKITRKLLNKTTKADTEVLTRKVYKKASINNTDIELFSNEQGDGHTITASIEWYGESTFIASLVINEKSIVTYANMLKSIVPEDWLDRCNSFYSTKVINIDESFNIIDFSNQLYPTANEIGLLSSLLGKPFSTVKRLTNNPIGLERLLYKKIFPPIDWYVSEKVDGIHALLFNHNKNLYLYSDDIKLVKSNSFTGDHIYECEHLENGNIILFDVLYFDGDETYKKDTLDRLELLDKAVQNIEQLNVFPKVYRKNWTFIKDISQINSVYEQHYEYEQDGLIFMNNAKYYDSQLYKWKPVDKMTIDFYMVKCPQLKLGVGPYELKQGKTLYWLCNGISANLYKSLAEPYNPVISTNTRYFPIIFSPPLNPLAYMYYHEDDKLEGRVIEMLWDNGWNYVRERTDRIKDIESGVYFGNDYKVAQSTWMMIFNPLTMKDMIEFKSDMYFKEEKSESYREMTAYNSTVKAALINHVCKDKKWVIDIAAGKGQDINRFSDAKVKHVTIIEKDMDAINEYIDRRLTRKETSYDLSAICGDMNDIENIFKQFTILRSQLTQLAGYKTQAIICNFAIHYFINNLKGFAEFAKSVLPPDGLVMITCFDGKKIFNLLKETKGVWEVPGKYKIEKRYTNEKMVEPTETTGEKIGVLLPFSGNELYEEKLVNFDYMKKTFADYNFKQLEYGNFMDTDIISEKFNINFKRYGKLNDDDLKFIGLYSYVIFKRTKD